MASPCCCHGMVTIRRTLPSHWVLSAILVFITASEYFARRFAETPYEEKFQNYFSTYFTITNLLTFVLILYMQNKVGEACAIVEKRPPSNPLPGNLQVSISCGFLYIHSHQYRCVWHISCNGGNPNRRVRVLLVYHGIDCSDGCDYEFLSKFCLQWGEPIAAHVHASCAKVRWIEGGGAAL